MAKIKLTVYAFSPRTLRNNPAIKSSWRFVISKGRAVVWDKDREVVMAVDWAKNVDDNCRETKDALPKKLVMSRSMYHNVSDTTYEMLQTLNVTLT